MTVVIGYGNTLRRDDALGVLAAERLGGIVCHQLTPELAPVVARADRVIFIDASAVCSTARCERLRPAELRVSGAGMHRLHPAQLLALAALYREDSQEAYLITGPGEDFSHGEGLSPRGAAVLEEVVRMARAMDES